MLQPANAAAMICSVVMALTVQFGSRVMLRLGELVFERLDEVEVFDPWLASLAQSSTRFSVTIASDEKPETCELEQAARAACGLRPSPRSIEIRAMLILFTL
jgi:hypothetical protein